MCNMIHASKVAPTLVKIFRNEAICILVLPNRYYADHKIHTRNYYFSVGYIFICFCNIYSAIVL